MKFMELGGGELDGNRRRCGPFGRCGHERMALFADCSPCPPIEAIFKYYNALEKLAKLATSSGAKSVTETANPTISCIKLLYQRYGGWCGTGIARPFLCESNAIGVVPRTSRQSRMGKSLAGATGELSQSVDGF